ncbi:hypothetical protein HDV02_000871 [Globomyces sp. JEL0801]|nr:hypothetical protein HDV02_000871 [Globomyces sp. JEL0801]
MAPLLPLISNVDSESVLSLKSVNQKVVEFKYAVRGPLVIRAHEIKTDLLVNPSRYPFNQVTFCNIGNPQSLKQKPITFFRQVSSLVEYPELMESPLLGQLYPLDVVKRAKELLTSVGGSVGSYSHSKGIPLVRQRIAQFIQARDGYPSDPESIFCTTGASDGVKRTLELIISKSNVGIMIPIPQYPLYTASIASLGGLPTEYYLNESENWGMTTKELQRALQQGRLAGQDVRALCVINPGNPTGQCLSLETMQEVIQFCKDEKLVLLADEVYQANIYTSSAPFHSFKKVLKSMGAGYDDVELISFHSISKGLIGECGRRGGYFECVNINQDVMDLMYKMASVSLCPPVQGQLMLELMVNPPKPGDASYDLYVKEQKDIYDSLVRRSQKLHQAFNSLQGMSCNEAQGAMYLFPQIKLPQRAIDDAKKQNIEADLMYCIQLLESTGVCVIPGSGFGQMDGTLHFRSTFLPPEDSLDLFITTFKKFHLQFMNKYS